MIYVPPGTNALHVRTDKEGAETIWLLFHSPDMGRLEYEFDPQPQNGRVDTVVQNPGPGVWKIVLFNRTMLLDQGKLEALQPRPSPMTPTAVNVEVNLLRMTAEADRGEGLTVSNGGAPIKGKALWSSLGSERQETVMLQHGGQRAFTLKVPAGARLLRAQFDDLSDPDAEVNLTAYQMVDDKAVQRHQIVRGAPGIPLVARIADPAPGEWRIVMDSHSSSEGGVRGVYRDVVVHEAYGSLELGTERFDATTGDQWRAPLMVRPLACPLEPRRLVGVISLGIRDGEQSEDRKTAVPSFGEVIIPVRCQPLPAGSMTRSAARSP